MTLHTVIRNAESRFGILAANSWVMAEILDATFPPSASANVTTSVSDKITRTRSMRDLAAMTASITAIILSCVIVWMHVEAARNVGGLWRDEVNSVEVATLPTWSELWRFQEFDSFPVLFFAILRGLSALIGPPSDMELRVTGALLGLGLVGAMWLSARAFRIKAPLLSLALVGLNPIVIRYGDSMRAYGLGTALMLLTLGLTWWLMESPNWRRATTTMLAAILAVQCLYQNAVWILAVCVAGMVVSVRRGHWRCAFLVLGIGAVAAVSLLPYLPILHHAAEWNFLLKVPFTMHAVFERLSVTLRSPLTVGIWIWSVLMLGGLICGVCIILGKAEALQRERDASLFAVLTLIIGLIGYVAFLKLLSYSTQPWYYILPLAMTGVCLEVLYRSWKAGAARVLTRSGLTLLFTGCAIVPVWQAMHVRHTNVDTIGHRLENVAENGDMVLINYWNYGMPLHRYYHGPATLTMLPPIGDFRVHRFDLVKDMMMNPDAIAPVLKQMQDTLKHGRTIWVVGGVRLLGPGQTPLVLIPATMKDGGFVGGNFYEAWSQQAGFLVQHHAQTCASVPVQGNQAIAVYENLELTGYRGWKDVETLTP